MRHLYVLLFCCATACFAQNVKVIGYLPHYRMYAVGDIEFERLTHVNIAFANPDADGDLSCDGVNVTPAITAAHAAGCKVFVSLGGGALRPEWESAWDSLAQPTRRATFIAKIIKYVNDNRFDGVDMDLEWQYVKAWYSPFVIDLKAALQPLGLPLTAALPGMTRYTQISNEALAAFDWVNMMIYDLTGPWDPSNPGPHAPFAWTQQCINYWKSQNVPARKLVVGVPFYGYDFGGLPVVSVRYAQLVAQDTANAYRDNINTTYWNGIPTIKAKTALAMQQTAGVMIWELGQDAFGVNASLSLLRAIDDVVALSTSIADGAGAAEGAENAEGLAGSSDLVVYLTIPNPAIEYFMIGRSKSGIGTGTVGTYTRMRIVLCNAVGETLRDLVVSSSSQRIDIADLPHGMYYALLYTAEGIKQVVVVKM